MKCPCLFVTDTSFLAVCCQCYNAYVSRNDRSRARDACGMMETSNSLTKLGSSHDSLPPLSAYRGFFGGALRRSRYSLMLIYRKDCTTFDQTLQTLATSMDLAQHLNGILMDAKYEEIRNLAAGNPATDSSMPPRDSSCPGTYSQKNLGMRFPNTHTGDALAA